MSISENTAKINQLITKINDLPSAAPTVRRVESSFTVNPVYENMWDKEVPCVYVECGFKPDVVWFDNSVPYDDGILFPSRGDMVFTEWNADYVEVWADIYDSEGKLWHFQSLGSPTETGFKITAVSSYDENTDSYVVPTGKTFNYVAIKYT